MKPLAILIFFALSSAVASAEDTVYQVVPNTSEFPLPYELPELNGMPASKFDWNKYLNASASDADRAFRARVARLDYGQPIPDGGDSNAEEMTRANLAAAEFKGRCDNLIRRYRLKLEDEPEILKDLNDFVTRSEEAVSLQVKLIGESWGGSGARVAHAKSRMTAYLNFYRNLDALGGSLHLQDLPQ